MVDCFFKSLISEYLCVYENYLCFVLTLYFVLGIVQLEFWYIPETSAEKSYNRWVSSGKEVIFLIHFVIPWRTDKMSEFFRGHLKCYVMVEQGLKMIVRESYKSGKGVYNLSNWALGNGWLSFILFSIYLMCSFYIRSYLAILLGISKILKVIFHYYWPLILVKGAENLLFSYLYEMMSTVLFIFNEFFFETNSWLILSNRRFAVSERYFYVLTKS